MTGRDYKNLMRLHRETKQFLEPSSNENYRQLSKLVNSAHDATLIKCQPVNYDLLKSFIAKRKNSAVKSLDKVKKLEDFSKEKREHLFIKNHGIIWLKEWHRLLAQSNQAQADMEEALKFEQNSIEYINFNGDEQEYFEGLDEIDEIKSYGETLNDELIAFKVRTIHPINDLKEDLEYCMQRNSKSLKTSPQMTGQIIETVGRVKNQQKNIIEKLESEAKATMLALTEITKRVTSEDMSVEEGVPEEAFELESPDEELRLSVLQEFIIIDFKYKEKLKHVDESHRALQEQGNGAWSIGNQEVFQHVYEHYHVHNVNMVNCNFSLRDLMFDRLRRTLEGRGFRVDRAMLVKFEEWNNSNKYFNQQKKLIINEWRESRRGLLTKAEAIFSEAFDLILNQRVKNEERERQLRVCQQLYDKVKHWRDQKMEALEIKQKIDEMIKRQDQERHQFEMEQRMRKREKEKQAIKDYKERVEMLKKQQSSVEQSRLDRLDAQFKEQAMRDQERIDFRRRNYREKVEKARLAKEKKDAEDEEREKRLEKFYAAVKPNVDRDPGRVVSFTEAEFARRGVVRKGQHVEAYAESKPLYKHFSYSDKQINADARLRIEARLRQAGLINSEYARTLIGNVKPPSEPRRDNMADSNWEGFAFGKQN